MNKLFKNCLKLGLFLPALALPIVSCSFPMDSFNEYDDENLFINGVINDEALLDELIYRGDFEGKLTDVFSKAATIEGNFDKTYKWDGVFLDANINYSLDIKSANGVIDKITFLGEIDDVANEEVSNIFENIGLNDMITNYFNSIYNEFHNVAFVINEIKMISPRYKFNNLYDTFSLRLSHNDLDYLFDENTSWQSGSAKTLEEASGHLSLVNYEIWWNKLVLNLGNEIKLSSTKDAIYWNNFDINTNIITLNVEISGIEFSYNMKINATPRSIQEIKDAYGDTDVTSSLTKPETLNKEILYYGVNLDTDHIDDYFGFTDFFNISNGIIDVFNMHDIRIRSIGTRYANSWASDIVLYINISKDDFSSTIFINIINV